MPEIALERVAPSEIESGIDQILRVGERGLGEIVDVLLRQSAWNKVSDLHFEPFQGSLRVRFRIDGIFQDVIRRPGRVHDQIIARLKVLANLIPHKRDIPQEGRISTSIDEATVDFRVSIVPTVGGERAVVRIFDPMRALFSIDDLGFPEAARRKLIDLLMDHDGLVLLTGPSSSGKTTTMYAGLQRIAQEKGDHASIVTIEDPVEYEIGIFSQIEVNRRVEMDFATTLSPPPADFTFQIVSPDTAWGCTIADQLVALGGIASAEPAADLLLIDVDPWDRRRRQRVAELLASTNPRTALLLSNSPASIPPSGITSIIEEMSHQVRLELHDKLAAAARPATLATSITASPARRSA